ELPRRIDPRVFVESIGAAELNRTVAETRVAGDQALRLGDGGGGKKRKRGSERECANPFRAKHDSLHSRPHARAAGLCNERTGPTSPTSQRPCEIHASPANEGELPRSVPDRGAIKAICDLWGPGDCAHAVARPDAWRALC